jgi:hypothetical protein
MGQPTTRRHVREAFGGYQDPVRLAPAALDGEDVLAWRMIDQRAPEWVVSRVAAGEVRDLLMRHYPVGKVAQSVLKSNVSPF